MANQITNKDIYKILESSFDQISERGGKKTKIPPLESWRKKREPTKRAYLANYSFKGSGLMGGGENAAGRMGDAEASDDSKPPTGKSDEENKVSPIDQSTGINEPAQGTTGVNPKAAENPPAPEPQGEGEPGQDSDSEASEPEAEPKEKKKEDDEEGSEDTPGPAGTDAPDIFKKEDFYAVDAGGIRGSVDTKVNMKTKKGDQHWEIINLGIDPKTFSFDPGSDTNIKQRFLFTLHHNEGKSSKILTVPVNDMEKFKNKFAIIWNTFKYKNGLAVVDKLEDAILEPATESDVENMIAPSPVEKGAPL